MSSAVPSERMKEDVCVVGRARFSILRLWLEFDYLHDFGFLWRRLWQLHLRYSLFNT